MEKIKTTKYLADSIPLYISDKWIARDRGETTYSLQTTMLSHLSGIVTSYTAHA